MRPLCTSPIDSLPPEILVHIFLYAIAARENNQPYARGNHIRSYEEATVRPNAPQLALAFVCWRWKHILDSSAVLWREISVNPCTDFSNFIRLLPLWISRSGHMPLRVAIEGIHGLIIQNGFSAVAGLMQRVFAEMPRMESLILDCLDDSLEEVLKDISFFTERGTLSCPLLKQIEVVSDPENPQARPLFGGSFDAPLLIEAFFFYFLPRPGSVHLCSLTKLMCSVPLGFTSSEDEDHARLTMEFLRTAPCLESLGLLVPFDAFQNVLPIHFECLTELSLSSNSEESSCTVYPLLRIIRAPKLVTLDIQHFRQGVVIDAQLMVAQLINVPRFINAEELSLTGDVIASDLHWFNVSLPNLKILRLGAYSTLTEDASMAMQDLAVFPLLRELDINWVESDGGNIKEVAEARQQRAQASGFQFVYRNSAYP